MINQRPIFHPTLYRELAYIYIYSQPIHTSGFNALSLVNATMCFRKTLLKVVFSDEHIVRSVHHNIFMVNFSATCY